MAVHWQNKGNRKGIPFQTSDDHKVTWIAVDLSLARPRASPQSRQLVGSNPLPTLAEHVEALITLPLRHQLRKTTKWGYMAVCLHSTTSLWCRSVQLEKCTKLLMICDFWFAEQKDHKTPLLKRWNMESYIYSSPVSLQLSGWGQISKMADGDCVTVSGEEELILSWRQGQCVYMSVEADAPQFMYRKE